MLVDLLADLLLLADRMGIKSFSQMVCVAGMHHNDETRETDCYGDTVSGLYQQAANGPRPDLRVMVSEPWKTGRCDEK
ncbi:hypothetical protein EL007_23755 (plasmid) [Salmonella enterica subsp. enterica serovar Karamoja]|nr:hypothetical protein [Salmonella enterica]AZT44285.1 hypothetical protein EL007_23755 [Salmonella enterica subsp. enterica serovar Karamoja]